MSSNVAELQAEKSRTHASTPRASSPLAAGARLPLAFIVAGIAAGILATAAMTAEPGLLSGPMLAPRLLALVHLWLLGALLTICAGAIYQLLPVLAGVAFRGEAAAWAHLGLHGAGVALMVYRFLRYEMVLVAAGGCAVAAGVVMLLVFVVRTARAAKERDAVLGAFVAATGWLLLTVGVGLFLAVNRRWGWVALDALASVKAHAHLGLVGFFVTLLQGASFRLVPMFTMASPPDLRGVGRSIALTQGGLGALVAGLFFQQHGLALVGAGGVAAGLAWSGWWLARLVATRRKRKLEAELKGFFAGLILIGAAGLLGVAMITGAAEWPRWVMAYGVLGILGGVLGAVQGMLGKIVPFLVWMRVYGPRVGREPTPVATTMGLGWAGRIWLWAHFGAVGILATALVAGSEVGVTVGVIIFALGQAGFGANVGWVLRHLGRGKTVTGEKSLCAMMS